MFHPASGRNRGNAVIRLRLPINARKVIADTSAEMCPTVATLS